MDLAGKSMLNLLLGGVLALSAWALAHPAPAPAVPPAGAQYGVAIPGTDGPSTSEDRPTPRPGNLSPAAQGALDEAEDAGGGGGGAGSGGDSGTQLTEEERRQLILAGTSPELGAPPAEAAVGPGTAATVDEVGAGTPGRYSGGEPGFLEAAASSAGGISLLLVLLLLGVAIATAVVAVRARSLQARGR